MESLMQIMDKGRISGKANDILTPELSAKIGAVHGTYLGGKGFLVVARDYSNNSRMLKRAYISGCMSAGINVLNLHSAPVSLLQFCIRRFGASGGAYFSSGHTFTGNTVIRFFDSSGIEFSVKHIQSLDGYFKSNDIKRVNTERIGTISSILQTFEVYKKAIPQFVDKKLISKANLKIVIDCSHGPTGELAPEILNTLNVNVIALNTYYRPLSSRIIPDVYSLRDASSIVRASSSNVGVVLDTDGSRLLLLDENGGLIDFEDIVMLFITYDESVRRNKSSPLISTTTASKILDDYCKNLGYTLKRINNLPGVLSRVLREERGAFGAADTHKFYFPNYGPFSDGILAVLKVLEILARREEPLSSLIRNFPKPIRTHKMLNVNKYVIENYECILKENLEPKKATVIDLPFGVKVVYENDAWVKVSPSLYRDALELSSEAPSTEISEEKIGEIEEIVRKHC